VRVSAREGERPSRKESAARRTVGVLHDAVGDGDVRDVEGRVLERGREHLRAKETTSESAARSGFDPAEDERGERQTMKKIQYDLRASQRVSDTTSRTKRGTREVDAREAEPREEDVHEIVQGLEEEEADLALRVLRVEKLERVHEGVDAGEERAVEPAPALQDERARQLSLDGDGDETVRRRAHAPGR